MPKDDNEPGMNSLLKGTPPDANNQWVNMARVLAIRDILISAGLTDMEDFNQRTGRKLEAIFSMRSKKMNKKRKKYGFGSK